MVLSALDLMGKVAIVTGCDTGLGQGMTLGLAQTGCDIVGINCKTPHDTAAQAQALGHHLHAIQADFSRQGKMSVLADRTAAVMDRVDILVNNVGIIRRHDALTFMESDWDAAIDLNPKAVFFLNQAVVRQFIRQGDDGEIINIASMLSFQDGIRVLSYTVSEGDMSDLIRLLANEWVGQRININAIAPGYMATNNIRTLHEDEERNQAIPECIPTGRWGEPKNLQGLVVLLASVATNYINGYTLAVDSG